MFRIVISNYGKLSTIGIKKKVVKSYTNISSKKGKSIRKEIPVSKSIITKKPKNIDSIFSRKEPQNIDINDIDYCQQFWEKNEQWKKEPS